MRKIFRGLCVFFLIPVTAAHAEGVSDLNWLAGCWVQTNGGRVVEEVWLRPSAGMMAGVGRTTRDGRLRNLEFMSISERDGVVTFTARPSGQAEASFKAVRQTPGEIVFENTAHDFPQKITYRSSAPGALYAATEGPVNGAARTVEFNYKRCEEK